jgi:DNA replication protein DnaC
MEMMQKETCDAVLKGHNVLIRGQGGTGKSFLLNIIKKELTKLGAKCNGKLRPIRYFT